MLTFDSQSCNEMYVIGLFHWFLGRFERLFLTTGILYVLHFRDERLAQRPPGAVQLQEIGILVGVL